MVPLRIPIATYRLQLNGKFDFRSAREIVPYLNRLGISDVYLSPILQARQGSTHGYDVVDPARLNDELGGETAFYRFSNECRRLGIGLLADIVPNHMALSTNNPYLRDVLQLGVESPYASFFDINWSPEDSVLHNKLMLPILGEPLAEAIAERKFRLVLDDNGSIIINYGNYRLPLNIKAYGTILDWYLDIPQEQIKIPAAEFSRLREIAHDMAVSEKFLTNVRPQDSNCSKNERLLRLFQAEVKKSPALLSVLKETINSVNIYETPTNLKMVKKILDEQAYLLIFWRNAQGKLNYRRFFDVNDLIALKMENKAVFDQTHQLILRLIKDGVITGLRIDHIDGLLDPQAYLARLQRSIRKERNTGATSKPFYIVVEKILMDDEKIPRGWQVCGTTGYDLLNLVNRLFIDNTGLSQLNDIYRANIVSKADFKAIVCEKKMQAMVESFPGELFELAKALLKLIRSQYHDCGLNVDNVKDALAKITAGLAVYRTYVRSLKIAKRDNESLQKALTESNSVNQAIQDNAVLNYIKSILLDWNSSKASQGQNREWLRFFLHWQQFTGAIMAKGFEDTVFYNYYPLLSLNEVGGNPAATGINIRQFHRLMMQRVKHLPYSLNTTATHDTKRGEDVRARLNVLTELPEEWRERITYWQQINRHVKIKIAGVGIPEANTEIFIYQSLIGSFPLFQEERKEFIIRFKEYIIKAVREAKSHTGWLLPNQQYEDAVLHFIDLILTETEDNAFSRDFLEFQQKIAFYGVLNSLGQVLLKATLPGVPDIYQGTETWDLSMVDPDNRRPVDFHQRISVLDSLIELAEKNSLDLVKTLAASWRNGQIKTYVLYQCLKLRRNLPELFLYGAYLPVTVKGTGKDSLLAFARRLKDSWVLVLAPRHVTEMINGKSQSLKENAFLGTSIILPGDSPNNWRNVFTGETIQIPDRSRGLSVATILKKFPLALLVGITVSNSPMDT